MAWDERIRTIERNGESKLKQKLPTLTYQDNALKLTLLLLLGWNYQDHTFLKEILVGEAALQY